MYLNTLDVKLNSRIGTEKYNLEVNSSTLEILRLIFEFKLASACHISRFLTGQDESKYIYRKLRRMWQAKLLESFKVFPGSMAGSAVFYMLSKKGLALLLEHGHYDSSDLVNYPKAKTLMSWGLFKHEAQVVELASLESQNKSANLSISFEGETHALELDFRDDKSIEALTPDYIALYKNSEGQQHKIYTEFERTKKSNEAMLNKMQRYLDFFSPDDPQKFTLRLIFQTLRMEQGFWLNIITNRPGLLRLNIVTTNFDLISTYGKFLEPIYSSESTVKLTKDGKLLVDLSQRIKLLSFVEHNS